MTRDQEVAILKTAARLTAQIAGADGAVKSLEQAAQDVSDLLNDTLPTKADGSAYTDAEIHAEALAAEAPFDAVIARDSK